MNLLKAFFSFTLLGNLVKNKSYLKKIAIFIQNFKVKIKKEGILILDEKKIFEIITSANSFDFYINEIYSDACLRDHWLTERSKRKMKKYKDWDERIKNSKGNILLYYALVRAFKPNVIVETGTASGSMTSFILAALNKNQKGKLILIDLVPTKNELTMDFSLKRKDIGFWIPDLYKSRWDYIEGDAKIELLKICVNNDVDFFIHDSLHTPSHMILEYSIARRFMKSNTLIASDDILWSEVFSKFLESQNLIGFAPVSNPNLGIFINSFTAFEKKNHS